MNENKEIEEIKIKLKTYVSSKPFFVDRGEQCTAKYYIAFSYPIIFIRSYSMTRDGETAIGNLSLSDLLEFVEKKVYGKRLLSAFLKALPEFFVEISEGTAKEEEYDATFVVLNLFVNKIGGVENLKFKHVLELLRNNS